MNAMFLSLHSFKRLFSTSVLGLALCFLNQSCNEKTQSASMSLEKGIKDPSLHSSQLASKFAKKIYASSEWDSFLKFSPIKDFTTQTILDVVLHGQKYHDSNLELEFYELVKEAIIDGLDEFVRLNSNSELGSEQDVLDGAHREFSSTTFLVVTKCIGSPTCNGSFSDYRTCCPSHPSVLYKIGSLYPDNMIDPSDASCRMALENRAVWLERANVGNKKGVELANRFVDSGEAAFRMQSSICGFIKTVTSELLDERAKNISLHFLLHLNEDFDDDLLQDAMELLH